MIYAAANHDYASKPGNGSVLSPKRSTGTFACLSIASSKFDMGVSGRHFKCCPVRKLPPPLPRTITGKLMWS